LDGINNLLENFHYLEKLKKIYLC